MSHPSRRTIIERSERDAIIMNLAINGASNADIARQVGLQPRSVSDIINRVMKKNVKVPSEERREMESIRLDRLLFTYFSQAESGDIKAAEFCLKVIKQRCDLWGLDLLNKPTTQTDPYVNMQQTIIQLNPVIGQKLGFIDVEAIDDELPSPLPGLPLSRELSEPEPEPIRVESTRRVIPAQVETPSTTTIPL